MAYCIRYIFEDDSPPSLATLASNMRALDAAYALAITGADTGDILFDGRVIGHGTLTTVEDPQTDPEVQGLLEELEALAEEDEDLDTDAASHRLWNATGVFTVEVAWEGEDHGPSLKQLNPLWGMLLGTYPGVLYAEREGYYDADGLLLEL